MCGTRIKKGLWLWSALLLAATACIIMPAQTTRAACGDTNPRTILCVDADATGSPPNGLTWTTAFTNVQEALDVANTHGGVNYEIWVAAGVYYPDQGTGHTDNDRSESFTLSFNNIQLYGGFAGTESERNERDGDTHVTILSGDIDENDENADGNNIAETWTDIAGNNAYHVLYLDGITNETITTDTVIDGFTITAGRASGSEPQNAGGGLYCAGDGTNNECSPSLNHITFSGNMASYTGGGLYNHGPNNGDSSPALSYVTFNGNIADYGGGMYNNGENGGASSPVLSHVLFSRNEANTDGGGMYNDGYEGISSPTVTNVIFRGNQTIYGGGGMYNYGTGGIASPVLTNVIFSGNLASDSAEGAGGGMYDFCRFLAEVQPTLTNVTFSGNYARYGGGLYVTADSTVRCHSRVSNAILWGNASDVGNSQLRNNGGNIAIEDSIVQGGCPANVTCSAILNDNPQFVDPEAASAAPTTAGDYHLQGNSPAIDMANPINCPADDANNNPRADLRCDIGAYERQFSDGNQVVKNNLIGGSAYSFGPTWVSMTLSAGDVGTITCTKVLTYPGGSADPGEMKVTWHIESSLSSGLPVTLSLCYMDAEVQGLDENALEMFRWDGNTWAAMNATPNPDTHCVTLSGVGAFSSWTLQDTTGGATPSAVRFQHLNTYSHLWVIGIALGAILVTASILHRKRAH